jgi:hypothetical protein
MKIDFVDFYPNFRKRDNYFYHLLKQEFEVEIDEANPDLVFMSCYGVNKLNYKNHPCKKIFWTGENRGLQSHNGAAWGPVDIDFDLTFTFDETQGSNVYLPLFVLYMNWFDVPHVHERDISYLANMGDLLDPKPDIATKTKGCCFLAKNATAKERVEFCQEAQKTLQVDCAGPVLNNVPEIGGRGDQIEKIDFLKKYRSIIAFENSRHPGYITEKILHGLCTYCVPIYWGAERVTEYFNPSNIILVTGRKDWPSAIKFIQQIMTHDSLYLNMVSQPAMKRTVLDEFDPKRILRFIKSIL